MKITAVVLDSISGPVSVGLSVIMGAAMAGAEGRTVITYD